MSLEKIHPSSVDCIHSELDLFEIPATAGEIERSSYVRCQPIATLSGNMPVEFLSKGTNEYVDLSRCYLRLKLRLEGLPVRAAGGAAPVIAPVNNISHSLFSQVDVYLNEQLISTSNTLYPYRCLIETLLNHGGDSKNSQLTAGLFYMDTAGEMSTFGDANEGFKKRASLVEGGKSVETISWIHADMFHQPRYLLPNVDLRIRLTRARSEFYLLTNEQDSKKTSLSIDEATFYVRKIKVSDGVLLAHAQLLAETTAKYPLNRVDMRLFSVPPNVSSLDKDNIFPGQLPQRVILAFVDSAAVNGSYSKNPFDFKHYKISYMALHVDDQVLPCPALTLDFPNNNYLRAYRELLENTHIWHSDKGLLFDREAFANGYTLFAFDLTPDSKHCLDFFTPIRTANVRLEVKFAEPVTEALGVVIYSEFENLLEVDQHGKVSFDYSA